MLSWIRGTFGTAMIVGIIGFIGFVFVFSGVFSPKATRGLHEAAVAGKVNGESIGLGEFNRAFNQRIEFIKNMMGGASGADLDSQLKAYRVRENVFQDLVRRKLLLQEAERQGMMPSDEEVRAKIREYPAFQVGGRFDVGTYKQVLAANNYSPQIFERMIREDLAGEQWALYFRNRVQVSELELRDEFLATNDKRSIKYVLLNRDSGKKGVEVPEAEVKKYLENPAQNNLVTSYFEQRKENEFKGRKLEDARREIARDLIAGEKSDQIRAVNEKLAAQILPLLGRQAGDDVKVNSILKSYGAQVRTTGLITRESGFVAGIGQVDDLVADAFAAQSPIDSASGGKAREYRSANGLVVALVIESARPDLGRLASEREELLRRISSRKQREVSESWLRKLTEKAKIDPNPAVVSPES